MSKFDLLSQFLPQLHDLKLLQFLIRSCVRMHMDTHSQSTHKHSLACDVFNTAHKRACVRMSVRMNIDMSKRMGVRVSRRVRAREHGPARAKGVCVCGAINSKCVSGREC